MNWISVKDVLPLQGEVVLAKEKYNDVYFIGYFRRGQWVTDKSNYETNGDAIVIDNIESAQVTHWMPLPEPPSEDL